MANEMIKDFRKIINATKFSLAETRQAMYEFAAKYIPNSENKLNATEDDFYNELIANLMWLNIKLERQYETVLKNNIRVRLKFMKLVDYVLELNELTKKIALRG